MTDNIQLAREMLAAEYEAADLPAVAFAVRSAKSMISTHDYAVAIRAIEKALSPSKGEREDIPDSDNQLTEELRQAIEDEANRQPATWDWYDLARAATQRIRRLKRAR